jgi:hypothetical protein
MESIVGSQPHNFTPIEKPGIWKGKKPELVWGVSRPQHFVACCALAAVPIGLIIGALAHTLLVTFVFMVIVLAVAATLNLVPYQGTASMGGLAKPKLADWADKNVRWHKRPGPYENEGAFAGYNAATGQPAPVAPPPPVGNIDWLAHHTADGREIGIAIHRKDYRTTAWLEVVPPPTGLSDPGAIDTLCDRLNEIHHRFANGSFVDMIVQITTVDPAGSRPTSPSDLQPSAPDTSPLLEEAHELQAEQLQDAPVFRSWWGVVLPDNKYVNEAIKIKGQGDYDAGLAAIVTEELTALGDALVSANYTVVGELNVAALVTMTRSAYDRDVPILRPQNDAQLDPRYAWPSRIDHDNPSYVSADGTLTSVSEVKMPWLAKQARFDCALMTGLPDIPRTYVLIKRLVPTDAALGIAESASVVSRAVELDAIAKGEDHGERTRMVTDAATARTERIARGDVGVTVAQYVLISAHDERTLRDRQRRLGQLAVASGRMLAEQWKDHHRAITVAMPFGQGLR